MIGHHRPALAQRARHVVAGRARPEGDVEQDHVEVALGRLRDRLLAVGHRRHAVALALERAREHLAQRLVVVDDEDVECRGGLHALTVAPQPATGAR